MPKPIVEKVNYSAEGIKQLSQQLSSEQQKRVILRYPTVYIINEEEKEQTYSVYIGETADINRRTLQHLQDDSKVREDWEKFSLSEKAEMYVIGHEHFNKSLTLDIENRLMLYLSSVDAIQTVYNRRTNQQNEYFTSTELDSIFSSVWRELRHKNNKLFPLERIIRDSAVFKASPFHKLTPEQMRAQDSIMLKIISALSQEKRGQLILVEGEAGSGKTVLMSSLFYEITQQSKEMDNPLFNQTENYLLVNHDQQLTVYEQIAKRLGITTQSHPEAVSKPTRFINRHSPEEMVDVVIVDEAHLLWTQGKQSYRGSNQLLDLIDRAKVVVAVFDPKQVLSTEQYWENKDLNQLRKQAMAENNLIVLCNQMRINASKQTVEWIRGFIDEKKVKSIPPDKKGYEIKVFSSPLEMYTEIQEKARDESSGISRIVATFDWEYINHKSPETEKYWNVSVGEWSLPWNLQLPETPEEKRRNRNLSWAEQAHTIKEVGSTFTVQGFDLNYVGVVIGPSVKYRNGEIVFDRKSSKNKKATRRRTLQDGRKDYFADDLLRNELNVLLTRGINGLYLYAVDEELQQALLKAQKGM